MERESDDAEGMEDAAAAARCAPSFAMMREREMRGFRAVAGLLLVVVADDARSGLAAMTATAAAASEVGRTGGGTAISGVLNILAAAPAFFPLRGLLVIIVASRRAELRGGVLARCATMLLVLDLATAPGGLRVLARELAVGANSLDDVAAALLGLNMLAVALLLLPSAALSSCGSAGFVAPGPLLVGPDTPRRCEPADNECVADERGRPTFPLVPMDEALLAEPASTLRRELVDPAEVGFKALAAGLLDKLEDRGFVGPFLFDVELGGLERDDSVSAVRAVVGALLDTDAVRMGAILFRPRGAPHGRDAGRDGFLGSPGFACLGSTAMSAVCGLVAAVVVVVCGAFVGDPALKFHTLRTIDLAEEKNPKRGFALPLSVRFSSVGSCIMFETGEHTV